MNLILFVDSIAGKDTFWHVPSLAIFTQTIFIHSLIVAAFKNDPFAFSLTQNLDLHVVDNQSVEATNDGAKKSTMREASKQAKILKFS